MPQPVSSSCPHLLDAWGSCISFADSQRDDVEEDGVGRARGDRRGRRTARKTEEDSEEQRERARESENETESTRKNENEKESTRKREKREDETAAGESRTRKGKEAKTTSRTSEDDKASKRNDQDGKGEMTWTSETSRRRRARTARDEVAQRDATTRQPKDASVRAYSPTSPARALPPELGTPVARFSFPTAAAATARPHNSERHGTRLPAGAKHCSHQRDASVTCPQAQTAIHCLPHGNYVRPLQCTAPGSTA